MHLSPAPGDFPRAQPGRLKKPRRRLRFAAGFNGLRIHDWVQVLRPSADFAAPASCATANYTCNWKGMAMEYVRLGNTGLKVSRICLGCMTYGSPATGELLPGTHAWALGEAESFPLLKQALDLGINFFDTANVYSRGESEVVVGNFLKSHAKRETIVLATKVHGQMSSDPNGKGLSRKAIFHELDQSLKRLKTDYVDLYQIHRLDHETRS